MRREKGTPPIGMDDDDCNGEEISALGRNIGKLDGNTKWEDILKKAGAKNMNEKIDEWMNSRKEIPAQTLQLKKEFTEKKQQNKITRRLFG